MAHVHTTINGVCDICKREIRSKRPFAHIEQLRESHLWQAVCDDCRIILTSPAASKATADIDKIAHNVEVHGFARG